MTVLVTTLMLISIVLLRQTMPPVMALAGITVVGIAGLLILFYFLLMRRSRRVGEVQTKIKYALALLITGIPVLGV
jgi:uncharacterized membrane protein